jgi:hypothetical protein
LNIDKDEFKDFIIIHIKNGGDTFITLSGNFLKTFLCNSLENLIDIGFFF